MRRTKQWATETVGDLWAGEGWGGEHNMDITENLKEVGMGWINGGRKDQGFGWGMIGGGE